jgi:hypothetical protein
MSAPVVIVMVTLVYAGAVALALGLARMAARADREAEHFDAFGQPRWTPLDNDTATL